jgi:penicillin-binding protein 1B
MSQAGEVAYGNTFGLEKPSRRVKIVRAAKMRPTYSLKRFFSLALVSLVLAGIGAGGAFAYFYNYYSTIVEARVRSGFWHSRGGVYAAPYKLRVGAAASAESVTEILRRSGYVEGSDSDGIWNGGFSITGNTLNITESPRSGAELDSANIKFANDRISEIIVNGEVRKEYSIEPEMLIGRTESKRTGNEVLDFSEIPDNLKNAIIVAEDQRFFSHHGIDPRGILRALIRNVSGNEVRQGGSTITQQLVKNTFLSPERSYRRKFAEAFLALALENHMSKEQIFALYCNEIYLGQYGSTGVHGIEQAAEVYFGKKLNELSLAESAAIAAMIKNPNRFSPDKDDVAAKTRRDAIISKMEELGAANGSEAELALQLPIVLAKPSTKFHSIAPHFLDAATRDLSGKFSGDYLNTNFNTRVYTTIDTHLQELAETAVTARLAGLDKIYAKKGIKLQASLVAIDPQNGHVLAMVGGRDYKESQFNRATDAMRQPGSTFKPFVYATALERGYTPITVFDDRPTEFLYASSKPYKPENYGDHYAMKNITLKTALAKSSNVVAVKTAFEAGLDNVAEKAAEFGFQNVKAYPSMALGTMEVTPLQLAVAYASFANGGKRVEPVFIDRIVSGEEKTLYTAPESDEKIISEQTAYMITDMLEATVERGTAAKANGALGRNVVFAGKTGSSKDGWFVGYTPNLVTVVWVGTDGNEDVRATGGEIALPLWVDFMRATVRSRPELGGSAFPMPRGLTTVVVDPETGMLADQYCPTSERVVMGTSSVSNIKCLLHQPRIDTMVAMDTGEYEQPTIPVTIPAVDVPYDERPPVTRPYIDEIEEPSDSSVDKNGERPRRVEKPDESIGETYLIEYSRREERNRETRAMRP